MKTLILACIIAFAFPLLPVQAASQDEEARFVTAIKQAFEKHDANALVILTCWDRVPDKFKNSGKKQYIRDVAQTATDITLTNPDPNYPDLEWKDTDGVSYRSNLPVVKQLKITFAPGGEFKDGRYPVGEKDGKLFLLEPAPITYTDTTTKTNTTKPTKTVSYKLTNLQNDKVISNPNEADIRAAVNSLDDNNVCVMLFKGDQDCLEVNWASEGKIDFQYKEGDKMFHTSKSYPRDIVVQVLVSYLNGEENWRNMIELKPGLQ